MKGYHKEKYANKEKTPQNPRFPNVCISLKLCFSPNKAIDPPQTFSCI